MMLECRSICHFFMVWPVHWIPWAGCWCCYGGAVGKASGMCPATAGFCSSLSDIQHPNFFFNFHISHFLLLWKTMFPFPSLWLQMSTFLSTHQYSWLIFSPGLLQLLSGYNSTTLNMEATLSTKISLWTYKPAEYRKSEFYHFRE
jgi:hypothetical protein